DGAGDDDRERDKQVVNEQLPKQRQSFDVKDQAPQADDRPQNGCNDILSKQLVGRNHLIGGKDRQNRVRCRQTEQKPQQHEPYGLHPLCLPIPSFCFNSFKYLRLIGKLMSFVKIASVFPNLYWIVCKSSRLINVDLLIHANVSGYVSSISYNLYFDSYSSRSVCKYIFPSSVTIT